ncbi:MAG: hypothetical protein Q9172_007260 [Xanthocarpia lactea]
MVTPRSKSRSSWCGITFHYVHRHKNEIAFTSVKIKRLDETSLDPHTYTSGRWLRRDKSERDARYIKFDFDELRKKVIELCHGAASIASYEKKEGGFNRIFIFSCDNGQRVVARLPTRVAGPCSALRLTPIFVLVQSNTTVPIPTILDWSDDTSNVIGRSDLAAYCNGLIDTGLSRLPPVDRTLPESPHLNESVATHTRLLSFGRDVIHTLSEDPRIRATAAPTLLHADLHKRNIFVSDDDPTIITDIIDWQSSSIEPAFEYADMTPDFAAPSPNFSFEDQPPDIIAEFCKQAFDICLQGLVPRLYAARTLDDNLLRPFRYCHRTWRDGAVAFRQELIEISSRWKELGLLDSCPYPLPTSDEMVVYRREFENVVAAWKLKQRLICLLDTTPDGWVPTEFWEATKLARKEAFDGIAQAMRDAEVIGDESMSEEELRKMWPFDI